MSYGIWVAEAAVRPPVPITGFAEAWEDIALVVGHNPDLARVLDGRFMRGTFSFYANTYSASALAQRLRATAPPVPSPGSPKVWLGLDAGRFSPDNLVTCRPAAVTTSAGNLRPPEAHPGFVGLGRAVAFHLQAGENGLFFTPGRPPVGDEPQEFRLPDG